MNTPDTLTSIIRDIEFHKADMQRRYPRDDPDWFDKLEHQREKTEKFTAGLIEKHGGKTGQVNGDGTRLRIAGVSTTCTSGLDGALSNWITAARRKIEK